jgi:competence transcription factor ComK
MRDREFVLKIVGINRNSFDYLNQEFQNDKEIAWISKNYCKTIKSIKTFDLKFKFSNSMKRTFGDI